MSSENNDLSPYELARLERIKRNEEKLRSLGLFKVQPKVVTPSEKVKKAPRKRRSQTIAVGKRSSKRLKALKEGIKAEVDAKGLAESESSGEEDAASSAVPEEEVGVNYCVMPNEPDQLDDHEFQVYVSLRKWRLGRKTELEVEPYKICQNKTLCHLIRRRRNESSFAMRHTGGDNTTKTEISHHLESAVEKDLLSIWGIGPSKATRGGFGWEMLEVLDLGDNAKLLQKSIEGL